MTNDSSNVDLSLVATSGLIKELARRTEDGVVILHRKRADRQYATLVEYWGSPVAVCGLSITFHRALSSLIERTVMHRALEGTVGGTNAAE